MWPCGYSHGHFYFPKFVYSRGVACLTVGIIIVVIMFLVVTIGTKEDEAIVLYYDAVDVTPEMEKASKSRAKEPEYDEGEQPAVIEDAKPSVTITVGGAAINKKAAPKQDTMDELRAAAKSKDPVSVQDMAQSTYTSLREGKL